MMTEKEKQEVRNILLTPIECVAHKQSSEVLWIKQDYEHEKILPSEEKFTSARISSTQKYRRALDPDMSDLAVKFYEIVYADTLKDILNERGSCNNCNFLGDTINSFNSIANNIPEAGKSAKERTQKDNWPDFLKNYHSQYHCLANFWVLPMCIGRTGTKINKYDSVDIFLNKLEKDYSVLEKHADYFKRLKTYEKFCEKHFIKSYAPLRTDEVLEMYRIGHDKKAKTELELKNDAEKLIQQAYKCMESRADSIISNETVCKELYECFIERKFDFEK